MKKEIVFFNSYRVSRGGLGASFNILTKEDVLNGKPCDRFGFIGGVASNICYMTLEEFKYIFEPNERLKAVELLKTLKREVIESVKPPTVVSHKDVKVGDVILNTNRKPTSYIYLGKCDVNGSIGYWYYKVYDYDKEVFNLNYRFECKKSKMKVSKIIDVAEIDTTKGLEWEDEYWNRKYSLKFLDN